MKQTESGCHLIPAAESTEAIRRTEQALHEMALSLAESRHELERQTSLMRSILDNLGDGVVVADATGKFLLFNPAAERIIGVGHTSESPDDWSAIYGVYQADGITLVPTDELPLVRALRGESCDRSELFIRNDKVPDGVWISVTGRPLTNAEGHPTGGVVVFHDVSERKRVEANIRRLNGELEERVAERTAEVAAAHRALSDFVENATIGLHWVAADGRIEWANRAELEMLGYSREEYVGRPVAEFHADPEVIDDILSRLQCGETVIDCEARLVCKDGSIKHVLINSSALTENGRFIRSRCFTRDITERKRSQARIEEQAALIDKATDAIVICDVEGFIRDWNQGARRLYGWLPCDAVGRNMHGLLLKTWTPRLGEAFRTTLVIGEWRGEFEHVTKDGNSLIVDSHWSLMRDADGRPNSLLILNNDLTEAKELQNKLLRAQRMESIGTLAGGIAHDLNNVLAPIMLGIDLLKMVVPEPEHAVLLDPLQTSAERGAEMVKQVLSFARGVQGERVELQLKHIIRDLHKMFERTLPKSIELQVRLPKNLGTIHGDPTQLHQVLMNLCVNARDAMPEGGQLTLTAENVQFQPHDDRKHSEVEPGSYVRLTVADTGTGIPSEIVDKIFDPFFTTKEVGKGTGLGLSTVLGIVKSHGGFVNVSSEVGLGTQFSVSFPAVSVAEGTPTHSASHETLRCDPANGESILLVDDDDSVREIGKAALELQGYRVMCAGNGAEAVAIFALHLHDIQAVITDMEMPALHGLSLIRVLRELDPDVRIIITSGSMSDAASAEAARLGVNAVLLKPYPTQKLLTMLRDLLQRRSDASGGRANAAAGDRVFAEPALNSSPLVCS